MVQRYDSCFGYYINNCKRPAFESRWGPISWSFPAPDFSLFHMDSLRFPHLAYCVSRQPWRDRNHAVLSTYFPLDLVDCTYARGSHTPLKSSFESGAIWWLLTKRFIRRVWQTVPDTVLKLIIVNLETEYIVSYQLRKQSRWLWEQYQCRHARSNGLGAQLHVNINQTASAISLAERTLEVLISLSPPSFNQPIPESLDGTSFAALQVSHWNKSSIEADWSLILWWSLISALRFTIL